MPGRSAAGPLVVGDTIIATSSSGMDNQRVFVTAVALESGKRLWQQEMVCRGRPYTHPTSTNAAPTAASDGEHVFAFYSSNDLLCISVQGDLKWYRSISSDYPKVGNDVGMSSSPVVVSGVVVVQAESQGDAFLLGINVEDGTTRWRVDRPRVANWASPTVMQADSDHPWILATSGQDIIGVDPKTGNKLFSLDASASTIASPTGDANRFYVGTEGLSCWQVGSPGTEPQKLWASRKLAPDNASPVIVGEKAWVVRGSVLTQGSTADGSEDWKLRLPDAGAIWATPVVSGDRLYVLSDNGNCYVVKVGDEKGELLATNHIDDTLLGSPALTDDSLIIRGDRFLWKISKPE